MKSNYLQRTSTEGERYAAKGELAGETVRLYCPDDNGVMLSFGAVTSIFLNIDTAAELGRHLTALVQHVKEPEADNE